MPSALVFLLMLGNDRQIMGAHMNGRLTNVLGVSITALTALAGGAYAVVGFLGAIGVKIG